MCFSVTAVGKSNYAYICRNGRVSFSKLLSYFFLNRNVIIPITLMCTDGTIISNGQRQICAVFFGFCSLEKWDHFTIVLISIITDAGELDARGGLSIERKCKVRTVSHNT